VEEFYDRVLADPELAPFFAQTNMAWLRKRQVQFFAQALGGPVKYKGRSMKAAHERFAMTAEHFGRVAGHLGDALRVQGAEPALITEIIDLVAPLQTEIVNTPSPADPTGGNGAASMNPNARAAASHTNGYMDSLEFVRACLSNVQANVFVADAKFNIVYVNDRAMETLRTIEDDVRKAFNVEVEDIVGLSIHRFHKDKRRVERILRNPAALPHQAEFAFGDVTLQAKINGIFAKGNEVLGYIVNWEDVSEKQRVEAEQARLASMLENAPTNVLLADKDLRITYVNVTCPSRRRTSSAPTSTSSTRTPPTSARSSPTTRISPCEPRSTSVPNWLICW
jgi:methyl-accepting chemotaxis protein